MVGPDHNSSNHVGSKNGAKERADGAEESEDVGAPGREVDAVNAPYAKDGSDSTGNLK